MHRAILNHPAPAGGLAHKNHVPPIKDQPVPSDRPVLFVNRVRAEVLCILASPRNVLVVQPIMQDGRLRGIKLAHWSQLVWRRYGALPCYNDIRISLLPRRANATRPGLGDAAGLGFRFGLTYILGHVAYA
jgi:hypothetical protein